MEIKNKFLRFGLTLLSERPLLCLLLILYWGAVLVLALFRFVAHTRGIVLLGISPIVAGYILVGFALVSVLLFVWRTMTFNDIILKMAQEEYTVLHGRAPTEEESKGVREQLSPIWATGHIGSRFVDVVALIPAPNITMAFVFTVASVLLKITFEQLVDKEMGRLLQIFFFNFPWLVALLIGLYLIYHDAWSIALLKEHVRRLIHPPDIDLAAHYAAFLPLLSQAEMACFQKKYSEQLRNKEIANQLGNSLSTVKSHVYNINKKWKDYSEENDIPMSLSIFMRQILFYQP
ncbi:MAG: hypothetical protein R2795_19910 [Saprospiraceae bacterium]